ncbi:MAG: hypothetical protein ACE37I_02745 [Rubinisphaera brasiliensis]|uniref:Uncharacterized protein n=1 Tax=Rubinisphaera brasiliensis (strain ATCC 49424 / DSM 5305 / JCM 21570 / IAM 15109 / NBRC 103401 / IFAM 1448) TaxID=756272 RepID=F0SNW3_RUBBR|nr:hypothetical protein [Rubinisphaera brasiliensis]ADY60039.1 hypothetical protein Plabr_2438 [Rubinisphaera brasiliensis DSM 5305]MBB03130.1 hypothetical protein [Planctomyces sp.]MBR9803233.1 hypothetical protein [bacterium]
MIPQGLLGNAWLNVSLLADLSEISRYSRNYTGGMQQWVLIGSGLALAVGIWVVVYVTGRLTKQKKKSSTPVQQPLINQVADAIGLSDDDVHTLGRLASRNGVQPPEVLLIDPSLWPPCLESFPHERPKLEQLMERLFGAEKSRTALAASHAEN